MKSGSSLEQSGFDPYIVLGRDDFQEMLEHGGRLIRPDYARFNPIDVLSSPTASDHVKALAQELF
jgi:hypothetical protein